MASGIIKRSIKVDGRSTSVSLEDAFYNYLLDIAREDGLTFNQLISKLAKDVTGNLSSALRVYALEREIAAPRQSIQRAA